MLLAEALAERADVQTRLEKVAHRATQMARVQEGDRPEEDPRELAAQMEQLLARLEELVRRINATNSRTMFSDGLTITDAIAARDIAHRRAKFYGSLADAAAARHDRYSRTEVKYVATVDVAQARALSDEAARRGRELDTRLQQLNWSTELL